jgi:thiol-disulfide isomerase/thioredoxin
VNIDSVQKALEQVRNIKSGKRNYTIHKANWCGYCIQLMEKLNKLMKEFNKAGKKITIQISTVDDDKLEMYNDMRTKNGLSPVESVESYPTIIRESSEKTNGSSKQMNAEKVGQDEFIETVNSTVTEDPSSTTSGTPMSMTTEGSLVEESSEEPSNAVTPIVPPSIEADEIIVANNGNNGNPKSVQSGGYGLYPAIASTAYHLAPAGILLATAAATFKCKKGKGRRNRSRKGKGKGRR